MSDLADALQSLGDATPAYQKAKAYAHGPINEVFASARLKRILKGKQVSFQDVLGDVVIGAVADKLEITAVTTDDEEATKRLAEQDERNRMDLVRPHVMRKALEYGDSYVIVWPETDGDGVGTGNVTISYQDPRTMRVLYDPEHPMQPRLAIQKWATEDKRVRVNLLFPPTGEEGEEGKARIERWVSKQPNGRASNAQDFEPFDGDDEPHKETHDHGFPVFHFTTTMPGEYGTPEHKPFYPTQDKINKLTVSHMAGVDYYAIPLRYALLEAGTDTSEAAAMDEDDFAVSPDGQRTEHADGQGKSTFSAEPGSLWYQKGVKGFGQFDAADPEAFLKPAKFYLARGAFLTSTPLYLFLDSADFPSGKALRTANAPLDKKTARRKDSFDATWKDLYTFVLELLGIEGVAVSLSWAPVQTVDEDEMLDTAGKKQELGVPADQTLEEIGYDRAKIEQWIGDGDGLLPQRIEMLTQVASALNQLTLPVNSGVVDKATVDELIGALMRDVKGETGDRAQ